MKSIIDHRNRRRSAIDNQLSAIIATSLGFMIFLCRLQSIAAHRDHYHFVWRLSVCPSVCLVVTHSYVSQATHALLGMLPLCYCFIFCKGKIFVIKGILKNMKITPPPPSPQPIFFMFTVFKGLPSHSSGNFSLMWTLLQLEISVFHKHIMLKPFSSIFEQNCCKFTNE